MVSQSSSFGSKELKRFIVCRTSFVAVRFGFRVPLWSAVHAASIQAGSMWMDMPLDGSVWVVASATGFVIREGSSSYVVKLRKATKSTVSLVSELLVLLVLLMLVCLILISIVVTSCVRLYRYASGSVWKSLSQSQNTVVKGTSLGWRHSEGSHDGNLLSMKN